MGRAWSWPGGNQQSFRIIDRVVWEGIIRINTPGVRYGCIVLAEGWERDTKTSIWEHWMDGVLWPCWPFASAQELAHGKPDVLNTDSPLMEMILD